MRLVPLLLAALPLGAAMAGEALGALQPLGEWLLGHPLLAPLLFVVAYALAIVAFLPGPLFCLLGGALFGPWLGTLLNLGGATLGAVLAFLIARHLAAGLVERHLNVTLQRLKRGVENQGWRFVAFLRLFPIVPFDLTCYAFGLTRIPLLHYAAASALSLLPRLAAYAYIGHRGRELLTGEGDRLLQLVSLGMVLVALLLLPLLYQRLRRPTSE